MHRVNRSFENFFRRVKAKKAKAGTKFDSSGRLPLSRIGAVQVCKDRPMMGTPKTCTITRRADGWYACIACETETEPLSRTGECIL